MRAELLAVLALAAAACRRAPEPAPTTASAPPGLSAPAPSSATITLPAEKGTPGFTNEMQADYLRQQSAAMGIKHLMPVTHLASEDEARPLTYAEGLERTRAMASSLAAQRRALDGGKPKSVDIPGNTPRLLQQPDGSAPPPNTP